MNLAFSAAVTAFLTWMLAVYVIRKIRTVWWEVSYREGYRKGRLDAKREQETDKADPADWWKDE